MLRTTMEVLFPVLTASPGRKAQFRRFDPFLNELELLNVLEERRIPPPLLERLAEVGISLSPSVTPARAIDAVFEAQGEYRRD